MFNEATSHSLTLQCTRRCTHILSRTHVLSPSHRCTHRQCHEGQGVCSWSEAAARELFMCVLREECAKGRDCVCVYTFVEAPARECVKSR